MLQPKTEESFCAALNQESCTGGRSEDREGGVRVQWEHLTGVCDLLISKIFHQALRVLLVLI